MNKVTVIEKGNKYKVVVNNNTVNYHKNDSVYLAGEVLGGHRVVYVENGKAFYADKENLSNASKQMFLTVNAASTDEAVTLRCLGELSDPSFDFELNKPVVLGNNGILSQVLTTTGFHLEVGKVMSKNKIFIDIKLPIIK